MTRYASLCARVMRAFLVPPRSDAADRQPANRRDLVGAVADALALRGRRRVRRTRLLRGGLIAGAATVVLVVGWTVSHRVPQTGDRGSGARASRTLTVLGNASPTTDRTPEGIVVGGDGGANRRPLARGMTLEPGTGLVAPANSEVRIGTAEGTVLTLEGGGELTVVEQSAVQRFSLRTGAVRAHVARLQPTERFVITTDDAEVEVHGTVFRVATVPADAACGKGARTRVSVFEGVVAVRTGGGETLVPAGGEWPDGCPKSEASGRIAANLGIGATVFQTRRARHPVAPASRLVASAPAGSPPTGAASVLTAQNDLFAAAIHAKQDKRIADSVRLFSQLVHTYPDGPLTEGAMAQRMKLLATIDPAAASSAASEYLGRFPGGFARVEARRLTGSAP